MFWIFGPSQRMLIVPNWCQPSWWSYNQIRLDSNSKAEWDWSAKGNSDWWTEPVWSKIIWRNDQQTHLPSDFQMWSWYNLQLLHLLNTQLLHHIVSKNTNRQLAIISEGAQSGTLIFLLNSTFPSQAYH